MHKAKHTPGPWVADIDRTVGWPKQKPSRNIPINPFILDRVVNLLVAKIPRTGESAEANALLIAAAPELLEALIYLRDCAESRAWPSGEQWSQVQSAIANATGGMTK